MLLEKTHEKRDKFEMIFSIQFLYFRQENNIHHYERSFVAVSSNIENVYILSPLVADNNITISLDTIKSSFT